ncbi:hypothetical protein I553_6771 [Mycobacterium xenopi 4042]|uniref:Protein-glutamine gamma-glutamyltransferase-like C-terminal domain-containing protein n=1 Tax=Mycobacterium xenopi 4042 TaxID=1299334 RepID=X7Z2F7_MYCXE|nr:hypothetical protein I553_6771 [Mycobacterium xenopi 4042]
MIVLLVIVAASLRGYIPEHGRTARQASSSPLSTVFVIALLAVTLAIMAIALIARLQDPRKMASGVGALPEALGGGSGRQSWRVVLVGLAVLVVWLVIVWALMRLLAGHGMVQQLGPQPPQPSTTPKPPTSNTIPPAPSTTPGWRRTGLPRHIHGDALGVARRGYGCRLSQTAAPRGTVHRGRQTDQNTIEKLRKPRSGSRTRPCRDWRPQPRTQGGHHRLLCGDGRRTRARPGAAPQAFDTPTEVLARAVDHHALHADNAAQLVDLFTEARFSAHVMNESHREAAVRALQLVLTELRRAA